MNYKKSTAIISIVLLFVFCLFLVLYERHEHQKAQDNIEKHALVIADSLWNSNPQGAGRRID